MMNTEISTKQKIGFSLDDLYERTSISKSFWRKEIKAGRLKATYFGRRVLVLAEDFKAYVDQKPNNTPQAIQKDPAASKTQPDLGTWAG